MLRDRRRVIALVLIALVAFPACREGSSSTEVHEPFSLEPIEGTDLSRVILEADAAERIDLRTIEVVVDRRAKQVPESAIWIDVEGQAWVYTAPEPLVFVRAPVTVRQYIDGVAVLSEGPPIGTQVVSVGVPELIGSEFGI